MFPRQLSQMFLTLISVMTLLPVLALAQKQERVMEKGSWGNEPVKIHGVQIKGKSVAIGEMVLEEDDWLDGLTVSIENTSDRVILSVEIELTFPRPGGGTEEIPIYLYRLFYLPQTPSDAKAPKQLLPGERVEIKLPEGEHLHIKATLAYLGYPAQTQHAKLSVGAVEFSDGTAWRAGQILHPDPHNPQLKTVKPPPGQS